MPARDSPEGASPSFCFVLLSPPVVDQNVQWGDWKAICLTRGAVMLMKSAWQPSTKTPTSFPQYLNSSYLSFRQRKVVSTVGKCGL